MDGNKNRGEQMLPPVPPIQPFASDNANHNKESTVGQEASPPFLIGTLKARESFFDTCPSAKCIVGYSTTLSQWCVIQIRCKRWGCRHCGERKMTHYGWKCLAAKPNKLITLTVANRLWDTPRLAFDGTKGKIAQLATRLRRKYEEFEYFKVLEVTKIGWPHYHLIARSPYIPQREISGAWSELTGAPIVDVRKIKKSQDVYFYVVKYLGKQKYIPWTNRRCSWSKNFFPIEEWKAGPGLELKTMGWSDDHPAAIIRQHFHPFWITQYSRDCWTIAEKDGFAIGEPTGLKNHRRKRRT